MNFLAPTPIQEQVLPCFERNQDVMASAQTGTGKTGAFLIPAINMLLSIRRRIGLPRIVILEPTRELAIQVFEQFKKLAADTDLNAITIVGGESMLMQERALKKGVDIIIATPGRLLDLCDKGRMILNDVKTLILDEADRMLDMGFIPDVEKLITYIPHNRQTILLSATFEDSIEELAQKYLMNPVRISIAPEDKTANTITQFHTLLKSSDEKRIALRHFLRKHPEEQIIVFCNRKKDVNIVYKSCIKHQFKVGELHGDMTQKERNATLDRFKTNEINILIASDVAARGIDVNNLGIVVNFDVPLHPEDYVHRIGRTGRAGKTGIAYLISLKSEIKKLKAVQTLIEKPFYEYKMNILHPPLQNSTELPDDLPKKPVQGFGALIPKYMQAAIS